MALGFSCLLNAANKILPNLAGEMQVYSFNQVNNTGGVINYFPVNGLYTFKS